MVIPRVPFCLKITLERCLCFCMDNKRKKMIFICLLLLGCGATSLFTNYWGENTAAADNFVASSEVKDAAVTFKAESKLKMKVYVSGAVAAPGIYELEEGARADAAIEAAGGFTTAADLERVNLVKRLKDGSHINVPTLSAKKLKERQQAAQMTASHAVPDGVHLAGSDYTNAGSTAYADSYSTVASDAQMTSQQSSMLVNINTATAAELENLPGIGPSTAAKIIEYRRSNRFNTIEDLMQVRGIGKAKFAKLKGSITI